MSLLHAAPRRHGMRVSDSAARQRRRTTIIPEGMFGADEIDSELAHASSAIQEEPETDIKIAEVQWLPPPLIHWNLVRVSVCVNEYESITDHKCICCT